MSNKEIYKTLGIKKGDVLSLQQILQITRMRQARDRAAEPVPYLRLGASSQSNPDPADTKAADLDEAVRAAVRALDPANDDHWTQAGLPAMRAVEQSVGNRGVSREDINRLMPGYERPQARG